MAGAERPGGPEAVDGGEKAVTAAVREDGESGDQLVVARDERRTVVWILRIAPPPAGKEPVSCHAGKALSSKLFLMNDIAIYWRNILLNLKG